MQKISSSPIKPPLSRRVIGVFLAFLGATAATQSVVKHIDFTDGQQCDLESEQPLYIVGYDYHDYPIFKMTWRPLTGPCGEELPKKDGPETYTGYYDSTGHYDPKVVDPLPSPDDPNEPVRLEFRVCAPFGQYTLELAIDSYSEKRSSRQQRTGFAIEDPATGYAIWDTATSYLQDDPLYSPTMPGAYVWPLPDATGFYQALYAGPLPPLVCDGAHAPDGTVYEGCYIGGRDRPFTSDTYELVPDVDNPDGMTDLACHEYCAGYDYFGTENASKCYCGTAKEFKTAEESDQCGASYENLCTGNPFGACGGSDDISIYSVSSPLDEDFASIGCYLDSKLRRLMPVKMTQLPMSAEICYDICNDGVNTHFGTQFGKECWCGGADPDLALHGEELDDDECDMPCAGSQQPTGEMCGGHDKMSAYEISTPLSPPSIFLGCYADDKKDRAMPGMRPFVLSDGMTPQVCQIHCVQLDEDNLYAGVQYGQECWCGKNDGYSKHGVLPDSQCGYPCSGNPVQKCGGYDALSVYALAT